MIKTELMMEKIWSEQLEGRMIFKALNPIYLADLKIQRPRFF